MASLSPGSLLGGKWLLRRRLGRGGMGEVWVSVHKSLEQEVALKVLDEEAFSLELIDEARSRFHLEAQLAAELSRRTRHIARVIDHGHDDGVDYLVMELLTGESLEDVLQREGRVEPARLAEIVRQIARGLSVAHAEQVIHRDLKPSNIFVTLDDDGRTLVKLLDFGIAKARLDRQSGPPSSHRTRAGVLLGTAAYMSPEQARGLDVDTRADVWALCCVAYELLTGVLPFQGASDVDLLMKICTGRPPAPTSLQPMLPRGVDAVFERAFAREIDQRWPDARSFADALSAALEIPRPLVTPAAGADSVVSVVATPPPMPALKQPRGRAWVPLAIGGVLALILIALLALRPKPQPATAAAPRPPQPVETFAAPAPSPVASPKPAPSPIAAPAKAPTKVKTKTDKPPATETKPVKNVDQGEIF